MTFRSAWPRRRRGDGEGVSAGPGAPARGGSGAARPPIYGEQDDSTALPCGLSGWDAEDDQTDTCSHTWFPCTKTRLSADHARPSARSGPRLTCLMWGRSQAREPEPRRVLMTALSMAFMSC